MEVKNRIIKIASNIIADWVSKKDYPNGPPKENGPWHETPKGYGNKKQMKVIPTLKIQLKNLLKC